MAGVYVVTVRRQVEGTGAFRHKHICLGQTDDLRQPLTGDGKSFAERGANCICVHSERDKTARLGIEQDLIGKYHSAGNA